MRFQIQKDWSTFVLDSRKMVGLLGHPGRGEVRGNVRLLGLLEMGASFGDSFSGCEPVMSPE